MYKYSYSSNRINHANPPEYKRGTQPNQQANHTSTSHIGDLREYRVLKRRQTGLMHELAAQLKFSESLIVHSLSSQLLKVGLEQVNTTILQFQDIQLQIENLDTGDDDYQIPE